MCVCGGGSYVGVQVCMACICISTEVSMCMWKTECGGLNENGHYKLIYLSALSLVGELFMKD